MLDTYTLQELRKSPAAALLVETLSGVKSKAAARLRRGDRREYVAEMEAKETAQAIEQFKGQAHVERVGYQEALRARKEKSEGFGGADHRRKLGQTPGAIAAFSARLAGMSDDQLREQAAGSGANASIGDRVTGVAPPPTLAEGDPWQHDILAGEMRKRFGDESQEFTQYRAALERADYSAPAWASEPEARELAQRLELLSQTEDGRIGVRLPRADGVMETLYLDAVELADIDVPQPAPERMSAPDMRISNKAAAGESVGDIIARRRGAAALAE